MRPGSHPNPPEESSRTGHDGHTAASVDADDDGTAGDRDVVRGGPDARSPGDPAAAGVDPHERAAAVV